MSIDLHAHSDASDGDLSPLALYQRAAAQGVEVLALTDHDTAQGLRDLRRQLPGAGPRLVSGIELSCVWQGVTLHVVGLGVHIDHPALRFAESCQKVAREGRARLIARRLERFGFRGGLDGARAIAGRDAVGRPHFAAWLLAQGHVRSMAEAFDRYLGAGKAGDVQATWPGLEQVIYWIRRSGGLAVLAHPLTYRLTRSRMVRLLRAFRDAGGAAIEVVSGVQPIDQTRQLARLAREHGLLASQGSDFHGPRDHWRELGRMSPLPPDCEPLWHAYPLPDFEGARA